jgi:hypothetical protein
MIKTRFFIASSLNHLEKEPETEQITLAKGHIFEGEKNPQLAGHDELP